MANFNIQQARMQQKHDIEANWLKYGINFIPRKGEIIIYDKDENFAYSRLKIGDGVTTVNTLPFLEAELGVSGIGENSIIFHDYDNNEAVSPYGITAGQNNMSGLYGFEIIGQSDIDVDNNTRQISIKDYQHLNKYYFDSDNQIIDQFLLSIPNGLTALTYDDEIKIRFRLRNLTAGASKALIMFGTNNKINIDKDIYAPGETNARVIYEFGLTGLTIIKYHDSGTSIQWIKEKAIEWIFNEDTFITANFKSGYLTSLAKGNYNTTINLPDDTANIINLNIEGLSFNIDNIWCGLGMYNERIDIDYIQLNDELIYSFSNFFGYNESYNGSPLFWRNSSKGYPKASSTGTGYFNFYSDSIYIANNISYQLKDEAEKAYYQGKIEEMAPFFENGKSYYSIDENNYIQLGTDSNNLKIAYRNQLYSYLNNNFSHYIYNSNQNTFEQITFSYETQDKTKGFQPYTLWEGKIQFRKSNTTGWIKAYVNLAAGFKPIRRFQVIAQTDNSTLTIKDTYEKNFKYIGALETEEYGTTIDFILRDETGILEPTYLVASDYPKAGKPINYYSNSLAIGENNIGTGRSSFVGGRNNKQQGDYGFTAGRNNTGGYSGIVYGQYCSNLGEFAAAGGYNANAKGIATTAFGGWVTADSPFMTAVGIGNLPISQLNLSENENPLFVVGNGVRNYDSNGKYKNITKSNILTITNNKVIIDGDLIVNNRIQNIITGTKSPEEADLGSVPIGTIYIRYAVE